MAELEAILNPFCSVPDEIAQGGDSRAARQSVSVTIQSRDGNIPASETRGKSVDSLPPAVIALRHRTNRLGRWLS
jgi:hypothetical protein